MQQVEGFPSLIGGGDCPLHYHSEDRRVTHDRLNEFQQVAKAEPVTGDYTMTDADDFIVADTTAGNITVTLPKAISQKIVSVSKGAAPYRLDIVPQGTDTVAGLTGISVTTKNTSYRLKAIGTNWTIV